ncbi:hypothetical protein MMC21_005569 [Puttea exsequens]|nr:hypothetical protein [Puttea exsequens]
MSDQQQTLSIPSLLLLAAFTAITIRYFLFTKSSSTASRNSTRTANPADVEQIATMFPQIQRRAIIWDLQRNGGSVGATTERILSRGGLDTVCISRNQTVLLAQKLIPSIQPPPSFQPPLATNATPSTAGMSPASAKPEHIDLIKRYNLTSKISLPPSTATEGTDNAAALPPQTWSNNKKERQVMLQRRREEMILNARRKLEEKERGQQEKSV